MDQLDRVIEVFFQWNSFLTVRDELFQVVHLWSHLEIKIGFCIEDFFRIFEHYKAFPFIEANQAAED